MHITPAQLNAHLKKGLTSLYTLQGDEPLLVQESLDLIRAAARAQGFTERDAYTVAGVHFNWSEVMASVSSLSLFADKKIMELRVPSGKPGKEGSIALQRIAEQAHGHDSTLTLVILPKLDKAAKATTWFAALDKGITIEVGTVERAALPQWIAQRLNTQGQRVQAGVEGQRTLQFFADRVEGNLLAAYQEIQKLALLHPPGELSFEQIEKAVLNVARYDVFKLSDAVLSGQARRVQRMLDGLQAEGEGAVLVHYVLAEDIRALKRIKVAIHQGKPLPMALREQKIWGTKERLVERLLPKVSDKTVAHWLQAAHQVDGIVKGIQQPDWPSDPWQAMQQLAMMVCRASGEQT